MTEQSSASAHLPRGDHASPGRPSWPPVWDGWHRASTNLL